MFIGIFNYYMDMWVKRSYILQPLTALTSHKAKFKCTDLEQKVFDDIKCAVSQDTLLEYRDLNRHFDIHTDASDYQLGEVIIQNGKPISFRIQKLTGPQTRYTLTGKKLVCRSG